LSYASAADLYFFRKKRIAVCFSSAIANTGEVQYYGDEPTTAPIEDVIMRLLDRDGSGDVHKCLSEAEQSALVIFSGGEYLEAPTTRSSFIEFCQTYIYCNYTLIFANLETEPPSSTLWASRSP
jgi:hypothetical protein